MIKAKILNGYNMARLGRFDVVHSHEDDMLSVTFTTEGSGERMIRFFIHSNGEGSWEYVFGSEYNSTPDSMYPNTPEMTIKMAQQGFNIEFDKPPEL